ncbi:MAG: amidinotransferase [Alphaproteobacteria bacterium]|nr:MAG: amidinotransferase [Alphaproteobacteria bacterium]
MTIATFRSTPPRFLMCPPQHFAVTYSINPWMDPAAWADRGDALHASAEVQWQGLHAALLSSGAAIETVVPHAGLPDLVFTANAAVVLDGKALVARFRHPERQREQPVFAGAFRALAARGLIDQVIEMPQGVALEGAGDCLWDAGRGLFWMGCGFRSDAAAAESVQSVFNVPCVALELANPSYYHLDTAMCALPCGAVVYYPGAFTAAALDAIHQRVAPADRIALNADDAAQFAANAICAGRTIILSSCSEDLRRSLEARGYAVVATPLTAFQRSGGSACCLTLRLDHVSQAQVAARRLAAAG